MSSPNDPMTPQRESNSIKCRWCSNGMPEWSADARVWIHRREGIDRRCENPPGENGVRPTTEKPMTPQRLDEIIAYLERYQIPESTMLADLRAHRNQLERNEWQPISTAPNTKDEVLIYEPPGNIRVATRIPDTNTYLDGTTYGIYDDPVEFIPTHWQPLPKPPEAK